MVTNLSLAYKIIATSSLIESNQSVSSDNIEVEAARIERCADFHYKTQDHKLHYDDYVAYFLQENYNDIVKTNKFSGEWLDDVSNSSSSSSIKEYPLIYTGE